MKRKGYRSAVTDIAVLSVVEDLVVLRELSAEVLKKVRDLPSRGVTQTELTRDLGFSKSSVRFLLRSGWLSAREKGSRRGFDLRSTLRLAASFPAVVTLPRIRTRRKRGNVVSLQREIVSRISSGQLSPRQRATSSGRLDGV
jgi:hypothetical protein